MGRRILAFQLFLTVERHRHELVASIRLQTSASLTLRLLPHLTHLLERARPELSPTPRIATPLPRTRPMRDQGPRLPRHLGEEVPWTLRCQPLLRSTTASCRQKSSAFASPSLRKKRLALPQGPHRAFPRLHLHRQPGKMRVMQRASARNLLKRLHGLGDSQSVRSALRKVGATFCRSFQ